MRFQNIENNRIYKLYRQDELQRLRKRIQQIKSRKNQHMVDNKEKHVLPYISGGYGFSRQKARQIERQNQRLQQRLQKVKNTRSAYFLGNLTKISSTQDHKKKKISSNQLSTHRSADNLLLPVMKSERSATKEPQKDIKSDNKQHLTSRPNNFRKEIMKIYNQSIQEMNKKKQQKTDAN